MVDIQTQAEVEKRVRERIHANVATIQHSIDEILAGNPDGAEKSPLRVRLRNEALVRANGEGLNIPFPLSPDAQRKLDAEMQEAIRGSIDFVGVNFLEIGRRAADAVGRVSFLDGSPQGTGFLVGTGLFLTNHHVIESVDQAAAFQVIFDYETDAAGLLKTPTHFSFDAKACFITDGIDGLDFTLIALGPRRNGAKSIEQFGFLPLSDASDKHKLGEAANIIQHPAGRLKELVLRENRLVSRDETTQVLHYVADTEGGSSGSPVFNNQWQVIALHHWGVPWREVLGSNGKPLAREVNEGIRISAIVRHLKKLADAPRAPAAVADLLLLWERNPNGPPPQEGVAAPRDAAAVQSFQRDPLSSQPFNGNAAMQKNPDGSVSFIYPLEITIRGPGSAPSFVVGRQATDAVALSSEAEAAKKKKVEDFSDRNGYEPGFIPGFVVPMPSIAKVKWRAAKNQMAAAGDDPHELRYHHFSIIMNADRKLCGVTAVNIDGARIKAVDRGDKTVIDKPTLTQLGIESFAGAEASDAFRPDPRVLEDEQMTVAYYQDQIIAGFPDPKASARKARMFQKGHIVLRGDPVWGHDDEAVAAERDTFFYTNAAPQLGFFNQGSELNRPGSKGKLRWRAVETYMLRNAVTMRQRVCVFAGPVFDAKDPPYRFDSKVPMKFWKIAVWSDGSKLRSIALLADQAPLLEVMPESMGQEAFGDEEELARVSEFVTTVAEIEKLTDLKFSAPIKAGDIRKGESAKPKPLGSFAFPKAIPSKAKRRPAKAKRRVKTKAPR